MRSLIKRAGVIMLMMTSANAVSGCGSDQRFPEAVYEKGLDDTGYLECMTDLLILDSQCRLQQSDRLFESCMLVHHKFCLESHEEIKRAGVQ
jgi:hypothetical protein